MMGALRSADDLDAIMEAAEALISPNAGKAAPAPISKDEDPSESSELAQAKPAGDVLVRPDEPAEAKENPIEEQLPAPPDQSLPLESGPINTQGPLPKGSLRGKIPYLFFFLAFGIWLISLLTVYLPISGLMTPVYPLVIDGNTMTVFLLSTALSTMTSLLIGLSKLGK